MGWVYEFNYYNGTHTYGPYHFDELDIQTDKFDGKGVEGNYGKYTFTGKIHKENT